VIRFGIGAEHGQVWACMGASEYTAAQEPATRPSISGYSVHCGTYEMQYAAQVVWSLEKVIGTWQHKILNIFCWMSF